MNTRYSKTTGCFYPLNIDYGTSLPTDVIEVSIEDFNAAMARRPDQDFRVSASGKVTISDRPAPSLADVLAGVLSEVRAQRVPILATLDGIAARMARSGDSVAAEAADTAITAVLDVTKAPALLAAQNADDMRASVKSYYAAVIKAAPLAIKKAFPV